jgi:putative transposase
MILAHKIALDPTVKQEQGLVKACGVARYTWNWALAEWKRQYESGEKPNANELKIQWNKEKPEWVYESPKDANQQPFTNLGKAFKRFFQKKARYPRFKRKGIHDSFYLSNDKFAVEGNVVRIPIIGWVRMTEEIRFAGKIQSASVSRTADRWFISFSIDVSEYSKPRTGDGVVGVDLGVKDAIVLSTGEKIEGPKPLAKSLKALRCHARKLSRKMKQSNRRAKSQRKVARLHARIANIRNDFLHKVTTRLCRENQTVAIEDLNVKGMTRNHRLARAISDIGFGEFRRQLEYKTKVYGTEVYIADRFFPSSKTCSSCGSIKESLALSEREFRCEDCGFTADRDVNAAINLRTLGLRGIYARGHRVRPRPGTAAVVDEARTKPYALVRTI